MKSDGLVLDRRLSSLYEFLIDSSRCCANGFDLFAPIVVVVVVVVVAKLLCNANSRQTAVSAKMARKQNERKNTILENSATKNY